MWPTATRAEPRDCSASAAAPSTARRRWDDRSQYKKVTLTRLNFLLKGVNNANVFVSYGDMCRIGSILSMIGSAVVTPQVSLPQRVMSLVPRLRSVAGDLRFVLANEHEKSAGPDARHLAGALAGVAASPCRDRRCGASLFLRPGARSRGSRAAALPAVLGRFLMTELPLHVSRVTCAGMRAAHRDGVFSGSRSGLGDRGT